MLCGFVSGHHMSVPPEERRARLKVATSWDVVHDFGASDRDDRMQFVLNLHQVSPPPLDPLTDSE
jgi:hypothetical protein